MDCPKCGMPMRCRRVYTPEYAAYQEGEVRRERVCPGCGYRVLTAQPEEKVLQNLQPMQI